MFVETAARFIAAIAAAEAALVCFETFVHALPAGDCFGVDTVVVEQV